MYGDIPKLQIYPRGRELRVGSGIPRFLTFLICRAATSRYRYKIYHGYLPHNAVVDLKRLYHILWDLMRFIEHGSARPWGEALLEIEP